MRWSSISRNFSRIRRRKVSHFRGAPETCWIRKCHRVPNAKCLSLICTIADEARKRFKTYVTLLSTIKNENNQKFLILRKKYVNECPTDEVAERAVAAASSAPEPSSPGGASLNFDSPLRQPPPYKNPPMVTSPPASASAPPPPGPPAATGVSVEKEHQESYKDCVNEFTAAITRIDPRRLERQQSSKTEDPEAIPQQDTVATRSNSIDEAMANKENIPRFSFSSGASTDSSTNDKPELADDTKPEGNGSSGGGGGGDAAENPISVKEATRKFNRMASEEEAKIISPPAKKKPEKVSDENWFREALAVMRARVEVRVPRSQSPSSQAFHFLCVSGKIRPGDNSKMQPFLQGF